MRRAYLAEHDPTPLEWHQKIRVAERNILFMQIIVNEREISSSSIPWSSDWGSPTPFDSTQTTKPSASRLGLRGVVAHTVGSIPALSIDNSAGLGRCGARMP